MSPITVVETPPSQSSDEADQEELLLARLQGDAFQRALDHMTQQEARGEEQRAGDYLVAYAVERAEGMYHLHDGQLMWQDPEEENAHIEIVVRDGADGRFVPGLSVTVTVTDKEEREIGAYVQPFLWHPWLYHYGRNWHIPRDDEYTLRVHIDMPDFMRHDRLNGKRFTQPVDVVFSGVKIETGQKITGSG